MSIDTATREIAEDLRRVADHIMAIGERVATLEEANRTVRDRISSEQLQIDRLSEVNAAMFAEAHTELADHEKRLVERERPPPITWKQLGLIIGATSSVVSVIAYALKFFGLP